MKSFLQDMTIALALILAFRFTHLALEWYHWAILFVGLGVYGYKNYKEGMVLGSSRVAYMTPEDFDTWLKSHNLSASQFRSKIDE